MGEGVAMTMIPCDGRDVWWARSRSRDDEYYQKWI